MGVTRCFCPGCHLLSAMLAPLPVPSAVLPCPAGPIFRVPLSTPCAAAMSPCCCSTPCQQHWYPGWFISTSPGSMCSTCHCLRQRQHFRCHCLYAALLEPCAAEGTACAVYTLAGGTHLVRLPVALHTPEQRTTVLSWHVPAAPSPPPLHTPWSAAGMQGSAVPPPQPPFRMASLLAQRQLQANHCRSTAVHMAQYSCDSSGQYTSRTAQQANPRARAKQADESTKDTHGRADPQ